MQVRTASTGVFLGCSGYALPPKERCKNTINLTAGDEAIMEDADDEAGEEPVADEQTSAGTVSAQATGESVGEAAEQGGEATAQADQQQVAEAA